MTWLDTTIIVIVIGLGLAIFYKALKEPADLLFGLIGRGIKSAFNKITGMGEQEETRSISYS